jgi:hypothetical protein
MAGIGVGPPSGLAAAPALLAAQNDVATNTFAEAVAAKMGVTRVFAAGGDHQGIQLQPSPGAFTTKHFLQFVVRVIMERALLGVAGHLRTSALIMRLPGAIAL